jgi:hypothetical protein
MKVFLRLVFGVFLVCFILTACSESSFSGTGDTGGGLEAAGKWKDGTLSFSFKADYCDIIQLIVVDTVDTSKVFGFAEDDTPDSSKRLYVEVEDLVQDGVYHIMLLAGNNNPAEIAGNTLLYSGTPPYRFWIRNKKYHFPCCLCS